MCFQDLPIPNHVDNGHLLSVSEAKDWIETSKMSPNDQTIFLPTLLEKSSDEAIYYLKAKKRIMTTKSSFNQQNSVLL